MVVYGCGLRLNGERLATAAGLAANDGVVERASTWTARNASGEVMHAVAEPPTL